MYIGVTFPQTEIGTDPSAIRAYVQAVEDLGYHHLVAYDHVLGGDISNRPYTFRDTFHEPFVLFGYLAALTTLELVPAVIILPQRQTALVAKQAAEVDILTGSKLRLGVGVGWNELEYEALGMNFRTRGRVIDEQIEVMRLLWKQELVTYKGAYHTITNAGINPLPIKRSIPIWIGGHSQAALRRVARFGDGWFPLGDPNDQLLAQLDQLRSYISQEGRDLSSVGIEARVSGNDLDRLVHLTEVWRNLGATHVSINTMGAGFTTPDQHIDMIRRYKEAIG